MVTHGEELSEKELPIRDPTRAALRTDPSGDVSTYITHPPITIFSISLEKKKGDFFSSVSVQSEQLMLPSYLCFPRQETPSPHSRE